MWPLIVLVISSAVAEDISDSSISSFERDDPLGNYDDDMRPFVKSLEEEVGTNKMEWDQDKKIKDSPPFPYDPEDDFLSPLKLKLDDLDWLKDVSFHHSPKGPDTVDMKLPILPLDNGVQKTISLMVTPSSEEPLEGYIDVTEGSNFIPNSPRLAYAMKDFVRCEVNNNIWVGVTICFRPTEYKFNYFPGQLESTTTCFEMFWPSLKFGANFCFFTDGRGASWNAPAFLTLYDSGDIYNPKSIMIAQVNNGKRFNWVEIKSRQI